MFGHVGQQLISRFAPKSKHSQTVFECNPFSPALPPELWLRIFKMNSVSPYHLSVALDLYERSEDLELYEHNPPENPLEAKIKEIARVSKLSIVS